MKKSAALIIMVLCLAVLTVSSYAAPYVAYWGFEGNGNETYNGYAPLNPEGYTAAEGKVGSAFSGENDLLAYSDVNIPITDNFTFSIWVKSSEADADGSFHVFLAKNAKGDDGHFEVYWNPDGSFCCYNTSVDGQNLDITSTENMMDGQWHNYIIRCEAGEYMLYVDGVFDKSDFFTQVEAAGDFYFGGLVDESLTSTSSIDEVFFANTIIPEEDVASLMNDTAAYAAKLTGATAEAPAADTTAAPEAPAADTAADTVAEAPAEAPAAAQTNDTAIIGAAIVAIAAAIIISTKKFGK